MAKFLDVRSEAFPVEPTEHLVEFFAEHYSNQGHWKLLKPDWPAEHTAEGLGSFRVSKLAPCYLQFQSDKLVGTLKS